MPLARSQFHFVDAEGVARVFGLNLPVHPQAENLDQLPLVPTDLPDIVAGQGGGEINFHSHFLLKANDKAGRSNPPTNPAFADSYVS